MRIRLLVLIVMVGLSVPTQLQAAPSGSPEATVTAASLNGSINRLANCDGSTIVSPNYASLAVIRTGSTAQPLTVDVSYGGTLTPGTDYPAQPDPVTIEGGSDRAILFVAATAAGTVTLTVEAGTGYAPGDPATTTAEVIDNPFEATCPPVQQQTVRLGATPTSLDVYGRYGGALGDTIVDIIGDVPPGLTYNADGSFTDTTTELGSFSFTVTYCLGSFCPLELPVTIDVVTTGGDDPVVGPAPAATPASPVAGRSTFTG